MTELEWRLRLGVVEQRLAKLENAVGKISTVLMEVIDAIRDEALKPPPM
jgi:hypothetical protein